MTRLLTLFCLPIFVSGCAATLASGPAICAGTENARKAHAQALLVDGGPQSQETGVRLLDGLEAGCVA